MSSSKLVVQGAAGALGGGDIANIEDLFATSLYTGNAAGQAVSNGIALGNANSGVSTYFDGTGDYLQLPNNSDVDLTNDFTVELFIYRTGGAGNAYQAVIGGNGSGTDGWNIYIRYDYALMFFNDNAFRITSSANVISNHTWHHIVLERVGNSVKLYVDGTQVGSTYNYTGTSFEASSQATGPRIGADIDANDNFQGYISNVRIVNNDNNVYNGSVTVPTSDLTDVTGTVLLTCLGDDSLVDTSANNMTVGANGNVKRVAFGPFTADEDGHGGMVWLKSTTATASHFLFDTERGATKFHNSNTTDAQSTDVNGVIEFNSTGFTLGASSYVNTNNQDFVSWTFRKRKNFFDIQTWTGTGANRTITHDLGCEVGCIIVKRLDSGGDWIVYHRAADSTNPSHKFFELNDTSPVGDNATYWNDTEPTSTTISLGANGDVNANGGTYVAYIFAHNDGDGDFGVDADQDVIKCGRVTLSGDVAVDLGFEPQFLFIKKVEGYTDNYIHDDIRGWDHANMTYLRPNTNNPSFQQVTSYTRREATGFVYNSGWSGSGDYIYVAVRRGPMAVPENASDVFQTLTYTGSSNTITRDTDIRVDALLTQRTNGGNPYMIDRMRGGTKYITTELTSAEGTQSTALTLMGDDFLKMGSGATVNSSAGNYCLSMWKRAPNFFDTVAYTGTSSALNVKHNLGVAPEMIWIKRRDGTSQWAVYHSGANSGTNPENYNLRLNDTNAESAASSYFNDTAPTASVFTVNNSNNTNGSGQTYIAYLFATLDGVSKVGRYTGTGSAINVDCGFSNGARFVIIKRSSGIGNWYLMDSERGIVAGNDPALYINDDAAQITTKDLIDPYSAGFTVTTDANVNTSGSEYIFYAIAQ